MFHSKPKGSQGSFFAKIEGESLPCISEQWKDGDQYCDPGANLSSKKWKTYFEAIRDGKKVILTTQKELENGSFRRVGYTAIHIVSNVTMSERGLQFSFEGLVRDFSQPPEMQSVDSPTEVV